MSSYSDYLEDAIQDHIHGGTAFTQPAALALALYTVTPSDAGGGTEVTNANGYARQTVTFGASSGGVVTNSSAETFTASGGNWGDIVAVGLLDSATHGAGNLLWWDGITTATINDGDSLTFGIGDISVTLT